MTFREMDTDETTLGEFPSARRMSLDDAFSDGGEDDPQFEFTSDAIRSELAKQSRATWIGEEENINVETVQLEREVFDPDASVSTIDIDGPSLHDSIDASPTSIAPPQSPSPKANDHTSSAVNDSEDSLHHQNGRSAYRHSGFPSVVIDVSQVPSGQFTTSVVTVNIPRSTSDPTTNTTSQSSGAGAGHVSPPPIPSLSVHSNGHRQTHRSSRSAGPSTYEKVMSKTRPSYLPPKAKQEDIKHLADWESMMKQSRLAEQQKKKAREERRAARERAVEQSTEVWEHAILPDWKNAVRDAKLRETWWNGVPPKLRGVVWEKAIGNALALSKDTFRTCLARAQRALSSGSFPSTSLHLIEEDINSTLPSLHIFNSSTGPMYQDLKDLLCAWVVSRSDEGLGYTTGASKIAAMLLLNMSPPAAFVAMRNFLERHCMRSFFGGLSSKDDVEAYYRIFDTLLADRMPKIYFNFKQHQVSPASYLPEWLIPVFIDHLPLEACARIWDVLVLEGDSFLFRAALGILSALESRLFFPERQALMDLLAGNDKAAMDLARREGRLAGICKYEIYALDEEVLWEQIDALNDWWKESTWSRLIQRELPDL